MVGVDCEEGEQDCPIKFSGRLFDIDDITDFVGCLGIGSTKKEGNN